MRALRDTFAQAAKTLQYSWGFFSVESIEIAALFKRTYRGAHRRINDIHESH
jgi:hypothetical protein